jgi:peptide/nickel transport system substrate-binding protein
LLFGSGPYRLADPESWKPGTPIELVRNEYYWGPRGTFERLAFKEIKEDSTQIVQFGNGEIDLIGLEPKDYNRLINDKNYTQMSQHLVYESILAGYAYIGWNQEKSGKPTPFADKRVRQAMTYLLDRQKMVDQIFQEHATVSSGPFVPGNRQADPNIKPYPYDEKKGKELLAEAGFKDINGDGIIEGPDGKPFTFELSLPSGTGIHEEMALFIKDNYARAGIQMIPKPLEWAVLLDRLEHSDFEACTLSWATVPESDLYQIFHSSQIQDQGDNRTHYINKDLDQAIESARKTVDAKKRMEYWHKAHAILAEDQPYTFLFSRKLMALVNNRLHNVKPTKFGLITSWVYPNPIPWYAVPTK